MNAVIGEYLQDKATGLIFKVLCSCPGSEPRIHTKRFIDQNPLLYRRPTAQEIQEWQSGMSQANSA